MARLRTLLRPRRSARRTAWTAAALVLFAVLAAMAAPARAQSPEDAAAQAGAAAEAGAAGEVAERLNEMSATLDQAGREIRSELISEARLAHWRERLPQIRAEARAIARNAGARVQSIRPLLEALGPPPEEGSEPAPVANERGKLNHELERYVAQQKQAELIVARVEELTSTLLGARRSRFTEQLLSRGPMIFGLGIWRAAGAELLDAAGRALRTLVEAPTQAAATVSWREAAPTNAVVLGLTLIVAWPLRMFLLRRYGRDRSLAEPSYPQRLTAAAVEGTVRALVPALAAFAIYGVLAAQGLLHGLVETLALTAAFAITFFFLVYGLSRAALAPQAPQWRVINFTQDSAVRLERMIICLAAFFAVDGVIVRLGRELQVGAELAVTHNFLAGLVVAAMILRLLWGDMWRREPAAAEEAAAPATPPEPVEAEEAEEGSEGREEGGDLVGTFRRLLVVAIGLTATAIPASAALGYFTLARFLTTRLVMTGVLVALVVLLHGLARELAGHALTPGSPACQRLQRVFAVSAQGIDRIRFWLLALLDLVLFAASVLLALALWGVGWDILGTWLNTILFGIRIGGMTLSLVDLGIAAAVFVAVVALSRALQRVMDRRVFPQTRLDVGVRHSLNAAISYGGLVVALLLAVSALGLDLSSLAIIAGALSVGIGFGLQTIVNNFVSGIILLIERPVKVGDWVVVGAYEGFVKKINVRATELETFDRSSVIVPNSDLVSSAVTNWTHKNRQCRLIVKVRVPYGCDTQKVHDLLLRCAREHRALLRWPAPHVLFMDFGESGLVFELRCYARDVDDFLTAPSELRFAIDRRLREAGIAIPHPGRDIYVRTIPWADGGGAAEEADAQAPRPARGRRREPRQREVPEPEAEADPDAGE